MGKKPNPSPRTLRARIFADYFVNNSCKSVKSVAEMLLNDLFLSSPSASLRINSRRVSACTFLGIDPIEAEATLEQLHFRLRGDH